MRQYLRARIQAANQIPLSEVVDATQLRNIKAREEHPEIRLYSIGHEGEADIHLPGIGTKTFGWIQAAIQKIADKLEIGTAVFDRHNPDTNSHEGRTQIGEVVGKTVKRIGERLNTLAAIYVYPAFKARPLDVASVEAEIEFGHDSEHAWPTDIRSVSGIALSNSGIDSPGFPGATLLSACQAFAAQAFVDDKGVKMNQSDVKAAIKDLGLKPSQIFEIEDIMRDSSVESKVKEVTKEHYSMANRVGKERDESRQQVVRLENEKAELEKTIHRHTMQSKSASVIDSILADPARKLDDKAKAFIKRNVKNFSTTADDEDALKAEVGKFVDTSTVEYKEVATLMGVTIENEAADKQFTLDPAHTVDGQQTAATNATQRNIQTPPTQEAVLAAEMDPKKNVLIPGGEAAKAALQAQ